ncbi:MAG: DUF116 domain-containing protein [Solirubrobacterales bacterium]
MSAKKRLYIGLLGISLVLITALFAGLWHVLQNQHLLVYRIIGVGLIVVCVVLFGLVALGIFGMTMTIIASRNIPSLEGTMRIASTLLFPIAVLVGQIVGIPRERIWSSYIEVNNNLVRIQKPHSRTGKIMILTPHCLQNSDCPHKVTMDPNNCKRCGKCDISALLALAEASGATLKVATGGTLARKFIKETRPEAVVAVACERDLSLGIQDANPLPVYGVLNQRPNGPCQDTTVDLARVEAALKLLQGGVSTGYWKAAPIHAVRISEEFKEV